MQDLRVNGFGLSWFGEVVYTMGLGHNGEPAILLRIVTAITRGPTYGEPSFAALGGAQN